MLKNLLQKLDYLWRLFAIQLFFLCFGIISLLLAYVLIPVLQLFSQDKTKERYQTQFAIHVLFRFMIFMLQLLGVARFQFKGFEELAADNACLILANHPTLIDYVAIVAQLPHCNTIVKESLCHNFFLKKVIKQAAYIPNAQLFKTMAAIKNTLLAGDKVLMFPEGTRTVMNQPIALKQGAAQIAIRTQAPIRFIHVTCVPPILTKQQKWYQIPSRKPVFTFSVGAKLDTKEFIKKTEPFAQATQVLTHYIQEQLQRGQHEN